MATLREVIARLEKHEWLLDRQVAFTFYSAEDVELKLEDINTDLSADEAWAQIVDEVQGDLDEGYWTEKIDEGITNMLVEKFGWKE